MKDEKPGRTAVDIDLDLDFNDGRLNTVLSIWDPSIKVLLIINVWRTFGEKYLSDLPSPASVKGLFIMVTLTARTLDPDSVSSEGS